MADATPRDVIDEIATVLRNNLTDPNPDRRDTSKMVRTIPIEYDIATYPRIHIQDVSSTHDGLSIGSTERLMQNRIQVSVFHGTGQGQKMDINGDGELESQNRIVDSLADDVITEINDNQATWRSLGNGDNIQSVLTIEEQRLQDERNSAIQHNIDARIRMER